MALVTFGYKEVLLSRTMESCFYLFSNNQRHTFSLFRFPKKENESGNEKEAWHRADESKVNANEVLFFFIWAALVLVLWLCQRLSHSETESCAGYFWLGFSRWALGCLWTLTTNSKTIFDYFPLGYNKF